MMQVIYKYSLTAITEQFVDMPASAKLLRVGEQFGELCVWALVENTMPVVKRKIAIIGTGNPIFGELGRYVGTAFMHAGALVLHVFDQGEE
jgi:hypothetical protein